MVFQTDWVDYSMYVNLILLVEYIFLIIYILMIFDEMVIPFNISLSNFFYFFGPVSLGKGNQWDWLNLKDFA